MTLADVEEVSEVEVIPTKNAVIVRSAAPAKRKKKVKVYLTRSSLPSQLLRDSFSEIGYKVDLNEASYLLGLHSKVKYDMIWCGCDGEDMASTRLQNRIPAIKIACRKGPMCQLVNLMHELFPGQFSFLPQSWSIPSQYAAFCHYVFTQKHTPKDQYFILKPDEGSQGDGIYLFRNPMDLTQGTMSRNSVVQRYIGNPLLIDGFKFDFRLYVLVSNLDPLEAYLCNEGLVRFCTQQYESPSTKNYYKTYMHLTNYSLNKLSKDFVRSENENQGSKRTLTSVMALLKSKGHDIDKIWKIIKDLVFKTLICIAPLTKVEQLNLEKSSTETQHFHLLGFDVLLDEALNAYLLEINGFPSMTTDYEVVDEVSSATTLVTSPVDVLVKKEALKGALHILFKRRADGSYCKIVGPHIEEEAKRFLIFEDCRKLYTMFLKKSSLRKGSMLGSSGFRSFVRTCRVLDILPTVTNAELDLLYITICHQHDSTAKSLTFLSFYRLLLTLAVRAVPGATLYEALKSFLDQCFNNVTNNKQKLGF